MKVHEKAKLYDSLIKDFEDLITEIETHSNSIKDIENRPDLLEVKEKSLSTYYPLLAGTYHGSNFGLEMKVQRAKGTLNWYKSIK